MHPFAARHLILHLLPLPVFFNLPAANVLRLLGTCAPCMLSSGRTTWLTLNPAPTPWLQVSSNSFHRLSKVLPHASEEMAMHRPAPPLVTQHEPGYGTRITSATPGHRLTGSQAQLSAKISRASTVSSTTTIHSGWRAPHLMIRLSSTTRGINNRSTLLSVGGTCLTGDTGRLSGDRTHKSASRLDHVNWSVR